VGWLFFLKMRAHKDSIDERHQGYEEERALFAIEFIADEKNFRPKYRKCNGLAGHGLPLDHTAARSKFKSSLFKP
jgi:hypothetical protein